MDDLVNHVNDQHVKVERPDVDYQCKWDGCPRRGKGFNARYVEGDFNAFKRKSEKLLFV